MTSIVAVGVDLSLTSTGIVAVCGPGADYKPKTGPQVLRQLRVVTKELRGYPRLDVVSNALQQTHEWLCARALRPRVYVFEGPVFGSHSASPLGQLHGVVKMDLLRRPDVDSFAVFDIPATTLKKFVTGSGKGEKNVMMKKIQMRWGFDSDFDDECDAYACSMVGLCLCGPSESVLRKSIEGKVEVHACPGEEFPTAIVVAATAVPLRVHPVSELTVGVAPGAVAGRFRRRRIV